MKTRLYLDQRSGREPFPLCLVISRRGQSAYINLGVTLTADQWNAKERRIAELPPKRWPTRDQVRNIIQRKQTAIETTLLSLEADGKLHGLNALQVRDMVVHVLEGGGSEPTLLLEYIEEVAARHNGRTAELYRTTASRIGALIQGAHALTLEDVTVSWLQDFDKTLALTSPSRNARNIHLRNIRAVMNRAIDDGLTNNYPFRRYKIRGEETEKRALTLTQVRQLLAAPVSGFLAEYRDVFELMMYLCGINLVDLANLTADSIKGERLEYVRAKTKKRYSVKIEPEAWAIIERHRGHAWLLDIHDRYKNVHDYLKHIDAGLKKILPGYPFDALTTYWARHTVATLMINELDVPKETVSAALGHELGSRITSVYIDFDRVKVDRANRLLIDLINRGADYEQRADPSHGSESV